MISGIIILSITAVFIVVVLIDVSGMHQFKFLSFIRNFKWYVSFPIAFALMAGAFIGIKPSERHIALSFYGWFTLLLFATAILLKLIVSAVKYTIREFRKSK